MFRTFYMTLKWSTMDERIILQLYPPSWTDKLHSATYWLLDAEYAPIN